MATQIIRQRETSAIPGISGDKIERVREFISAVGEVLRLGIGAAFGTYAEVKRPESFSPTERAGIDAYRWGMHLR